MERYRKQEAAEKAAREVERAEAVERGKRLQTANKAWFNGEPLPGLPDLAKRVYIMPGTLICNSGGLLSGGAATTALLIGECSVIKTKMEVKVFPPTDGQGYMEGAANNMVL